MVSRTVSDDSEPVLEVSAVGTATSDGEYLGHEAVAPHRPHAVVMDPMTVVVRSESTQSRESPAGDSVQDSQGGLRDIDSVPEEITAVTKSRLRARGWGVFRALAFVEAHRMTTLMFVVGALMLLFAAVIAVR